VRDLEFNLFEVLGPEQALAGGAFGDLAATRCARCWPKRYGWPKAR
jgi:hypothetical protein